ncbi:hypothetical protein [Candidatus Parabeggiatoa sp. HSG14]|uniref:hypothetical protein n=1 Tax=Candidatus Parabeggiatoa sp. HSG14 TaxID=3055593 RepID=UPI0025A77D02|nr:hypothetical protein [Thiotrichales bacterium HSG14]
MKRLFYKLIFCLWLLMGIAVSLPVTFADDWIEEQNKQQDKQDENAEKIPQTPFDYERGERLQYNKCLANFNRGKKCHALLDRLCNRINNQNLECRLLRVEQCHEKNRKHQTKAEKTCEHGAHQGPCYGIVKKCRSQEYYACKETNYQERYCAYYKWQYCRQKVGMVDGQFKSKDCRAFHNKEMIKFYERKISKALRWEPRGENNIEQSLASMKQQRNQMVQQIEAIEKQEESLQGLIKEIAASFIPEIEKQQKSLKKRKKQLRKQIREISIKIREYSYMGGLCEELGPY